MDTHKISAPCVPSFCEHARTVVEHYKPGASPHHGALKCADCGAFLRFVPKPENAERWKANTYRLAKLQMCDDLSEWERHFVDDLARTVRGKPLRLTPAQQKAFDAAYAKHFGKAVAQ